MSFLLCFTALGASIRKESSGIFCAASIITASYVLTSCGFVQRNTIGLFSSDTTPKQETESRIVPPSKPSKVSIEEIEPEQARVSNAVEIIWEIPKDPVDGFVIHYGYLKDRLDLEKKITTNDLQKYEDPNHGFVYRYLLSGVAPEKPVFVAISAFQSGTESQKSDVLMIPPEEEPGHATSP